MEDIQVRIVSVKPKVETKLRQHYAYFGHVQKFVANIMLGMPHSLALAAIDEDPLPLGVSPAYIKWWCNKAYTDLKEHPQVRQMWDCYLTRNGDI